MTRNELVQTTITNHINKIFAGFNDSENKILRTEISSLKNKRKWCYVGFALLCLVLIGFLFLIPIHKLSKAIETKEAKIIANISCYLDQLHLNDITKQIFSSMEVNNKMVVSFGINKKLQALFHTNLRNPGTSYRNIFSFYYNGYRMLMITEKRLNSLAATSTIPPVVTNNTRLCVYVEKPNNLSYITDVPISTKEIQKFYKKHPSQTALDSMEFDSLYPLIRDNEINLRVVFTPLTQDQLVSVHKQTNIDYTLEYSKFGILKIGSRRASKNSWGGGLFFRSKKNPKEDTDVSNIFNIFHDLNYVNEKDALTKNLISNYINGINLIETYIPVFNAFALYKSPYFKDKNIDEGSDDLIPEDIEISMNNSNNYKKYFPRSNIPGTIQINKFDPIKDNVNGTANVISFSVRTETYGSGNNKTTITYYDRRDTTLFVYAINNEKYKISKYWKYKNWELFKTMKVIDIFEVNNHIVFIFRNPTDKDNVINTVIQTK